MEAARTQERLKPEHELVLELSQFRTTNGGRIVEILEQKLDLTEILGHLTYNRTAGIAYHVFRQVKAPYFNREFEMALYLIHQIQGLRTSAHKQHIVQIADAMNASGLPHAFLKGAILAHSIYPVGCRVSSDIDLLLNEEDLAVCDEILTSLGFVQGFHDERANAIVPATRHELISYRMNFGELVPYRKVVNEPGINLIEIDINFSLDWLPTGTEQAVKNFIRESQWYNFGADRRVRALQTEYFLAHLCVHLYKEARVLAWVDWQRDLGLYKFVDIYGFLTDPDLHVDWHKFGGIIRDNNIVRECYYALEHTRTLFPVLDANSGFVEALQTFKPDNVDYLDQVIDGTAENITYQWKTDFITRLFDLKRLHALEKLEA